VDLVCAMNNILKRILVGVCIVLVMMLVHKVSHAAIYWVANGNGHYSSAQAACSSLPGQPLTPVMRTPTEYYCNSAGGFPQGMADSLGSCDAGNTVNFRYDSGPKNRTAANTPAQPNNVSGCEVKLTDIGTCAANAGDTSPNPHLFCHATAQETGRAAPPNTSDANVAGTGASANPEPVQTQGSSDGSCPSGTANIGSDSSGTPICRGNGSSSGDTKNTTTTTPTTTTNNSDGSTTTSSSTSNGNNDGSTTTTTTTCTTATDGAKSCSVTGTTGANASGGSGKSDGKPDDLKDFCASHPDLTVCVNSTVGGGGCSGASANLSFTGDAITGAILRQQRDEYCANSQATNESKLGGQLMSGQDPDGSKLPTPSNGQTIAIGSLDQSGFLGGGSCFADKTYSLMGVTSSLPLSQVCPYLLPLRYGIMVVAALVSLAVMRKSILG
jgi:hypothetical protein